MLLCILLEHSDAHGNPNRWGGHLHFVVGCDARAPVQVSQMRLLARYLNYACGVAAVESCGRTMGKPIPADQTIENDEGNTGGGCDIPGLIRGLHDVGLTGTAQHATPGRLWIMNVANASVTPPAQSQPYLAAAAVGWPDGWCVTIDMPATPAPPPEADMGMTAQEQQAYTDLANGVVANKRQTDARAVEWGYIACLGRTIEPGAFEGFPGSGTVQHWVNSINGGSFEDFIAELLATAESKAWFAGAAPDIAGHPGATALSHRA
jgi:hypothetical protein